MLASSTSNKKEGNNKVNIFLHVTFITLDCLPHFNNQEVPLQIIYTKS